MKFHNTNVVESFKNDSLDNHGFDDFLESNGAWDVLNEQFIEMEHLNYKFYRTCVTENGERIGYFVSLNSDDTDF